MTDRGSAPIPKHIHDAAADWLARRDAHPGPETEAQFRAWLEADDRHRRAYRQLEVQLHPAALLREGEAGRTRALARAPFWMRHRPQLALTAASLAALVVAGTVGLMHHASPVSLVPAAEAASYETGLGEIRSARLADGSRIVLDTSSAVRLALGSGERRITLERGRARFEVAQDPARPFVVSLPAGEISARQAAFDVSLLDGAPQVTALSGSVELRPRGPAGTPSRLGAGRSGALALAGTGRPASPADVGWVTGTVVLDGKTTLGEAARAINRYNRLQLRIADPHIAARRPVGTYRVRDPRGFARALSALYGLVADRSEPDVILLRKAAPTDRPGL